MRFYAFVAGPLLWISFGVFILGLIYRIFTFLRVSREKDKIIYQHLRWRYVFLSLGRWLAPLNKTVAKSPDVAIPVYLFHFCLIVLPIFLRGHIILWEESRFGLTWPSLPPWGADLMTLVVVTIGVLFLMRRVLSRDVRLLSTFSDYALLVVTVLPFLTGFFLTQGTLDSLVPRLNMQIAHMLTGELMLILIPFTKLSHFVLFFFSRGATAVEFGRRGYSI